jgi:hypothetical protein
MSEILVNQLKTAAGQSTLQFDSTGDVLLSTGRLGRVGGSTIEIDSSGQFVGTNAFTGAVTIGDGLTVDNDGATVATFDRATSHGTIIDLQKDGSTVGTIGVYDTGAGLDVYMADTVCGLRMSQAGTDNIMPCNADGSNSDNDIDLGSSTTRFKDLYLSGGIYLGGTGAANHLDDYEEGTWTPAIASGTLTVDFGRYRKIGNQVTIWGHVENFSDRSTSEGVAITGLPFTAANNYAASGSMFGRYIDEDSYTVYFNTLSQLEFYNISSGNWNSLNHSSFNNANSEMYFFATYTI